MASVSSPCDVHTPRLQTSAEPRDDATSSSSVSVSNDMTILLKFGTSCKIRRQLFLSTEAMLSLSRLRAPGINIVCICRDEGGVAGVWGLIMRSKDREVSDPATYCCYHADLNRAPSRVKNSGRHRDRNPTVQKNLRPLASHYQNHARLINSHSGYWSVRPGRYRVFWCDD